MLTDSEKSEELLVLAVCKILSSVFQQTVAV
jgi:hypothetical protein